MVKKNGVTFTPDEIDAIEKVVKIDCDNIACSECPFKYGKCDCDYCMLYDLKRDMLKLLKIAGVTTPTY